MNFNDFRWRSLKTKVVLVTLALFVLSIGVLATYIGVTMRSDMQRVLGEQQVTSASLAATQINADFQERMDALQLVARSMDVQLFDKPASLQAFIEQRPIFQILFNAGVFITRSDGTAVAELPLIGRVGLNYMDRDHVAAALTQGKATVGKPIVGKKVRAPSFAMTVPIRNAQGHVIGALVGATDLSKPNFMDNLSDSHYGRSGGYLIVDPGHKLFVTATNRNLVMEPLPAKGVNPVLDRRLQGFDGAAVNVNSLGTEVLTSSGRIPNAGWFLIATLPTLEAFAPVDAMVSNVMQLTMLLTVLASVLMWWLLSSVLRRQFAPILAATQLIDDQSATEYVAKPLPITTHDEVGGLFAAFNRLLASLMKRQGELADSMRHLSNSEALLLESQKAANIGSYVNHLASGIIESSATLDDIFGITADYPHTRQGWVSLIHADSRQAMQEAYLDSINHRKPLNVEYRVVRPSDGAERWMHELGKIHYGEGDEALCLIGTVQDITERKRADELVLQLAYYDQLTKRPNRTLLNDRLIQAMLASKRSGNHGTLIFLDLDNFKSINDTRGHDAGDLLLVEVAERLRTCVRQVDTVARFGGDEFVVLINDLPTDAALARTQAELVAVKIRNAIALPYLLQIPTGDGTGKRTVEHRCTASLGVVLFKGHEHSEEDVLKWADLAMYKAKDSGRNSVCVFDSSLELEYSSRVVLELELRQAILNRQFRLYYQPQVAGKCEIIGVEALLRWQHPVRGVVSPGEFLETLEKTGLILPLGLWVMETACAQLALWATRPETAKLTMAINVTAWQFHQGDFVDQVLGVLERSGASPRRVKLELTESAVITNVESVVVKMKRLKAEGIGFSLDDFGTGYSSLVYLKRLPIDQLKIAQEFVRDILIDPDDVAIAKTVISLAGSLDLGVIAEGVETEEQRDLLASMGCGSYQGYLFSRPVPIEALESLLGSEQTVD